MKKTFLYFFIPFLTIWLITWPSRALALIPLIPGVQPLVVYFGGTAALATAIDYSLAIHGAILFISFNKDPANSVTTDISAPITVKLNPASPLPTPAGWTAPVPPSINPQPSTASIAGTPPAGTDVTSTFVCGQNLTVGVLYKYVSGNSAYQFKSVTSPLDFANGFTLNGGFDGFCETHSSFYQVKIISSNGTCPSGYTLNADGVNCNVTSPNLVQKPADSNCQVKRTGNTFLIDGQDPDCVNSTVMSDITVSANTVTTQRANGVTASVTIFPDGTATVSETYPDIAQNKTSVLTTSYSAPDASGNTHLTGVSVSTTPGVGTLNQGSGIGAGGATETTQTAVLNSLNDIKNGTGVVQPTPTASLETALGGFEGVAGEVTGISTGASPVASPSIFNPFVPVACTTLGWTFKGRTVVYDICPWVPKIQAVLGAALYLVTAGLLFTMFMRRPVGVS